MARLIDPALASAIMAGGFHPAVLIAVEYPGDPAYLHNGVGPITWDGKTWTGVGDLGFVTLPPSVADIAQDAGSATLGGLPEIVAEITGPASDQAPVQVWFGAFTSRAGGALVSAPLRVWSGRIDEASHEITPEGDSDLAEQARFSLVSSVAQTSSGIAVHSHEDQSRLDPADTVGLILRAALVQARAKIR